MNFTYETQENATYLVYSIAEGDVLDTVSLGMIMNNKVPGLAPVFFAQMDAQKFLRYNVSSKISVQQFFDGVVTRNKLVGVFSGIIDAMLAIEDYMIDTNTMLLDLNYIYTDVSTYDTHMICWPVVRENEAKQDLATFFKNIVFGTKFDQTENCEYVAKLLTYFNSATSFSLVEFKKVLDDIAGKRPAAEVKAKPAPMPNAAPAGMEAQAAPMAPANQNMQNVRPQQPVAQNAMNGGAAPMAGIPNNGAVKMQTPSAVEVPMAAAKEAKKPGMFAGLLGKGPKDEAPKEKKKKEKEKKEKKVKNAAPVSANNLGIAIPGQPSFDIPGGNASMPARQPQKPVAAPQQAVAPQPVAVPRQVSAPQQAAAPRQVNTPQQAAPIPQQAVAQQMSNQTVTQVQGGFGETTVLSSGASAGETTVLSAVSSMPFLLRVKNNERIMLNKPVFRIGKERSFVDYFISDNPAISRSHANIVTKETSCFVVDTNSTNHTYVNGEMLQSNMEILLNHGDKIRFANEEFEFRVY